MSRRSRRLSALLLLAAGCGGDEGPPMNGDWGVAKFGTPPETACVPYRYDERVCTIQTRGRCGRWDCDLTLSYGDEGLFHVSAKFAADFYLVHEELTSKLGAPEFKDFPRKDGGQFARWHLAGGGVLQSGVEGLFTQVSWSSRAHTPEGYPSRYRRKED